MTFAEGIRRGDWAGATDAAFRGAYPELLDGASDSAFERAYNECFMLMIQARDVMEEQRGTGARRLARVEALWAAFLETRPQGRAKGAAAR